MEMVERAQRAAKGCPPGDADVECRGGRKFPIARKDTALLVIDMQNDFLSPDGRIGQYYKGAPLQSCVPAVERVVAAARKAGIVIAYSRSYRYGSSLREDLVGSDDRGFAIVDSLAPQPGDLVADKWTFGAFASNDLEQELRSRGVERVLLCGAMTNVGIFATASQGVDRFFRVLVVSDGCAAVEKEWHELALDLINEPQAKGGHNAQPGLYFGEVATADAVTAALQRAADGQEEPPAKRAKAEVLPAARASEVASLARDVALGPLPGEAQVRCRGGRLYPVNCKDTALVIIDMQTDFLSPTGRIGQHYKESPIRSGLEGVERLLKSVRAHGMTVAHSRSHRYGSAVRNDLVGIGDEGYEFCPSVAPREGEIVVDKWTFGAFASTPLEEELRARGVTRILLCGVLTNVCVFATAVQAIDRFMRVCLVEDACAGFSKEWHEKAVRLVSAPQLAAGHHGSQLGLYFGEVCTVGDVEAALPPGKAS